MNFHGTNKLHVVPLIVPVSRLYFLEKMSFSLSAVQSVRVHLLCRLSCMTSLATLLFLIWSCHPLGVFCSLPGVKGVCTHPSLSLICSLPRPSNTTHLVFFFSYRTHLCHTVISVTWSRRSEPMIGFSLVQAILLGLGLQHKTVDELEVSISRAQAESTFRPHFTTLKSGLHARRKHKHKPRVNRDDFFLRLSLRRPGSHVMAYD